MQYMWFNKKAVYKKLITGTSENQRAFETAKIWFLQERNHFLYFQPISFAIFINSPSSEAALQRCSSTPRWDFNHTSGKRVLKTCSKFTGEHPCRSGISVIKLQSNLLKSYFSMAVLVYICCIFSEHLSLRNHWRAVTASLYSYKPISSLPQFLYVLCARCHVRASLSLFIFFKFPKTRNYFWNYFKNHENEKVPKFRKLSELLQTICLVSHKRTCMANVKNVFILEFFRIFAFVCANLLSVVNLKRSTKAVVQRCSIKKVFLEILQNPQENTCARVSFLIKLGLRPATLLKKRP